VPPNGGRNETPPDKPLLRLHRTAARADMVPAGPAVCCKRLLGQPARAALATAVAGRAPIFAIAAGNRFTYPVACGGALHGDVNTATKEPSALFSPRTAVETILGRST
jgi:hypothetical protein